MHVRAVLDRVVLHVERQVLHEERLGLQERRRRWAEDERREQQRTKELRRVERETERQVEEAVERLIKRLEKSEALTATEDGRPYVEPAQKKSKLHSFKVRGEPAADYFVRTHMPWCNGPIPSSPRDGVAEAAVKSARMAIRLYENTVDHTPQKQRLSWVQPSSRGRDWNCICLHLG